MALALVAAALRAGLTDGELQVLGTTVEARIRWATRLLARLAHRSPAIRLVERQLRVERLDPVWDDPERARRAVSELQAAVRRLRDHGRQRDRRPGVSRKKQSAR